MNNSLNLKEINDVQKILTNLFPLIDQAEKQFTSARNWGVVDMLGGGFIVDLIKHSKINNAKNIMTQINYLLHDLQRELKDIAIPTDFSMNTATFATFADFIFDGALADIYMESKIISSLDQVKELRYRLQTLQNNLSELKRKL